MRLAEVGRYYDSANDPVTLLRQVRYSFIGPAIEVCERQVQNRTEILHLPGPFGSPGRVTLKPTDKRPLAAARGWRNHVIAMTGGAP